MQLRSSTVVAATTSSAAPQTFDFGCAFCGEDKTETTEPHKVGVFDICLDCVSDQIVPQFTAAAKFEFNYPPRCGAEVINIQNFADVLPDTLIKQYQEREKEYKTPKDQRVYCQHKIILTGKEGEESTTIVNVQDMMEDSNIPNQLCETYLGTKGEGKAFCDRCHGESCRGCGSPRFDDWKSHTCTQANKEADKAQAFEGLVKGQHYQDCPKPGCGSTVELMDGCNHVVCHDCQQDLCFCCGAAVSGARDNHWNPGQPCPRFGRPGAENAIYSQTVLDIPGIILRAFEILLARDADSAPQAETRAVERIQFAVMLVVESNPSPEAVWAPNFNHVAALLLEILEHTRMLRDRQPGSQGHENNLQVIRGLHAQIQTAYRILHETGPEAVHVISGPVMAYLSFIPGVLAAVGIHPVINWETFGP